jgi:mortality factor 4-like protein 1
MDNRWDDWVGQDRIRKLTEENRQLAHQLHEQMKALQARPQPKSAKKKAANGSDLSSARGSEERTSANPQPGRGAQRRNRDYDLEPVSFGFSIMCYCLFVLAIVAP